MKCDNMVNSETNVQNDGQQPEMYKQARKSIRKFA